MIALEEHVMEPQNSSIFKKYPRFTGNRHALEFLCGSLRPIIDGKIKPDQLRLLLDAELDRLEIEHHAPVNVLTKTADAMPGFGIVAAVLGIVITMASISGPVEAIGVEVAAALVGTFLGILLAYGFLGPLAMNLEFMSEAETGLHAVHRRVCHRICQRHGSGHGGGTGPARVEQRIAPECRGNGSNVQIAQKRKIISRVKNIKRNSVHHGGSWKVAYADFVTAMMALFLCLWLTSQDVKDQGSRRTRVSQSVFQRHQGIRRHHSRTRTSPPRSSSKGIFNPSPPWKWKRCASLSDDLSKLLKQRRRRVQREN